jgi:cysteinyl-tRNA synthetase
MKLLLLIILALATIEAATIPNVDFKAEMRKFVVEIANYARLTNPNFIVIPQNGHEVMMTANNIVDSTYMNAINGVGQEDLFYGYESDNIATKATSSNYMIKFLDLAKRNGKAVLVTDYCSTPSKMDDSYIKNQAFSYISFAANRRDLDIVPAYPVRPWNENAMVVTSLNSAKNFLYLINPNFNTKIDFINAVKKTNHDVVIVDAFFHDQQLTSSDVQALKIKSNGGKRLVIAYMSIGEAEDYRFYWKSWKVGSPTFVDKLNPDWAGNYKVRYWDPEWKKIIFGNDASYTKKLLTSGFDGTYLDIIDAFEYFEYL